MKLTSTTRQIEVFYRKGGTLAFEIPLTLELEQLKKFVKPLKWDFELYNHYKLSQSKLRKLLSAANIVLSADLRYYEYFLSCSGIYDWEKK